jgi:hypothetical protein
MTVNSNRRSSLVLNWVARVLGLIVTVLFLSLLIGDMVASIQDEGFKFEVESLYIILPVVIALAGYILGWWHRIAGGVMLVFVAVIFAVLTSISAWQHQMPWSGVRAFVAWSIIGLPLLIVGALYLLSAYLDRKPAS